MNALNIATKANIIGAIVGIITAAATAFLLFRKRGNEATDAMKKMRDSYSSFHAEERKNLDILFEKLKKTNPKSEERKKLVKELIDLAPDLQKQTLEEITNTNNLAAAYDAASASIRKRALTKAYEGATQNAYEKGIKGETLLRGSIGYDLSDEQMLAIAQQYINRYNQGNLRGSQGVVEFSKENKKAIESLISSRKEASNYATLAVMSGGGGVPLTLNGDYRSSASDSITGGGRQVKNFYITIDSLIKENTNMFQSSNDNPDSAQDFMSKLSESLQRVVNDVNYAAA
jgi:gas vesicle protein